MSTGYTGYYSQPTQVKQQTQNALPVIDVTQQLRDIGRESLDALIQANNNRLYRQEKQLVRLEKNDDGKRAIVPLTDKELLTELTHAADFVRYNKNNDKIAQPPPPSAIRYIQGVSRFRLRFPRIERIVTIPQVKPDGSILQAPGYDSDTCLYYDQSTEMKRCLIPDYPTKEDALNALAHIEDYFGQFSFVSASDKANAYGLLLTPFLRPYFTHKQHIPLALIDASDIGEGKTLLADCFIYIWTGNESTTLALSESESEQRKAITTALDEYPTVIHLDNIDIVLKSGQIARALTNYYWGDRYLGGNRQARLPNNAVWIGTGNQIRVKDDMLRRVYRSRLASGISEPYKRPLDLFRHKDLLSDVQANRPELIADCLTLIRYWFMQDKPRVTGIPDLATFTTWARTIGGILQCVGIDSFLSNLDEMRYEVDSDSGECEAFYSALFKIQGNKPFKSIDLLTKLRQTNPPLFDRNTEIPSELSIDLDELSPAKIGKWLSSKKDKAYGYDNIRIRISGTHARSNNWYMESKPHAHVYDDKNVCTVCEKNKADIENSVQMEVNNLTIPHHSSPSTSQTGFTMSLNNGEGDVKQNTSNTAMENMLANYDVDMH